jgi:TetR/AcrR family transcriptional repressor of nem operon
MARPRTFDPADALDAAQCVFQAKGYEAASVQDLVDATGLSRSSLYAAFGDKHGLYLAVLDRYADAGRQSLRDLCECDSPLGALRAHFERLAAEPAAEGPVPLGCLMANAAAERASCDPDTARRAAESRRGTTETFERLVRDAQAAGEVGPNRDAGTLAHFLTGAVYGLHGLKKAGADANALGAVVETTLAAVASGR